ncbi:amidohydrolase family protein [Qingshengfaniella alkalisoli]|uniref:Amidohydrolase family protein n=1 Tax=Qingshengfaniella alkalisoli TaxID=2599296 RepID=A0A5B8J509_9RHOB|nr:amidohydrolase family protein [Qingshengfaniella alkalisoli]QDY69390.1 amidohydrolase family protein [Qingshengfaniella alkalisoli]
MIPRLPPLRLSGAFVLRDGLLQQRSIAVCEGRLAVGPYPAVDLSGYYVLPGIVDAQSRSSGRDSTFTISMMASGVTTAYVGVSWGWTREHARPDVATAAVAQIATFNRSCPLDLRIQLRCDPLMAHHEAALLDLVQTPEIGQVVFTNGAARAALLRDGDPDQFAKWSAERGRTVEHMSFLLDRMLMNAHSVPRHLCKLAERFDSLGIVYGSTEDDCVETREHRSMIGARLCMDPPGIGIARAARAVGDAVFIGAARALAGTAAGQGWSAIELIQHKGCDALVSNGDPAALCKAVFRLVEHSGMDLAQVWRLVSEHPARVLRLPDRGMIAPGKRADLVVVNARSRQIEATICDGRLGYVTGEAADRFRDARLVPALAAE